MKKRSERAHTFKFKSWRDFTPLNTSRGTMLHNLTGNWRFIKPFYEDKVPSCQNTCPAGNDIEGWITLLLKGDIEGAGRHLRQEEPFPSILGRVCFKFCQNGCNRSHFDHCVNIKALERFVGDRIGSSTALPEVPEFNGATLAVVGSGPAGMSAAYFSRLLGFRVTIFEEHPEMGGLLRTGIPEYRLPREVVQEEFKRLEKMGIVLKPHTRVGADLPFDKVQKEFDYVFLATGGHKSLELGIRGEAETPGVMSGLSLLKQVALGHTVNLGKTVVVIGGGNTAIDAARTAIRLGAHVTVIYRRSEGEMPAHAEEVQQAREEGVHFKFLAAPERIEFGGDGRPLNLICGEMTLGTADDSGRKRPIRKPDANFAVKADTILTAIGEVPELGYLPEGIGTRKGMVPVGDDLHVEADSGSGEKIFAGGDLVDIPHTVVHAVSTGKKAAVAMDCDRQGLDVAVVMAGIAVGTGGGISFSAYKGLKAVHPVFQNRSKVVTEAHIVFDYFKKVPPVQPVRETAAVRKNSFNAITGTYSMEDALAEAARCMHCGRCTGCDNCLIFCPDMSVLRRDDHRFGYRVDYDYCKGCGICYTECPRHALTMVDEETPLEEED